MTKTIVILGSTGSIGRQTLSVADELGLSVAALTAVNYRGVQKSARLTRALVVITLAVLTGVVAVLAGAWIGGQDGGQLSRLSPAGSHLSGVLQAAALLFFAFAGYARIATLGEEVRDPARTIPRAIPAALGIALVVYVAVAISLLATLGADELARATAPLAQAVGAVGASGFEPVVRAAAAAAALGSLLSLILGVSRTALAMARDGHLPPALAMVHPRFGVPHRAELAVGAVVATLAAVADVRGAIGFSSFAVLLYYAIANASALTLRGTRRAVPGLGLAGCLLLAAYVPGASLAAGAAVAAAGAVWFAFTHSR